MIVALVGVKGSGKSHKQAELVKHGFAALDFKDELLAMASDLLGYDVRESYDYFKGNLVGLTAPAAIDSKFMQRRPPHQITAEVLASYPQALTGRVMLQRLGTEVIRKRDPGFWARAWRAKAEQLLAAGKSVVCADCRFHNEIEVIQALARAQGVPARFLFCNFQSERYCATDDHPSEALAQHYLREGYNDGDEIKFTEGI